MRINRRRFLQATAAGLPLVLSPGPSRAAETTQMDADGFFTIDRRDDRWWFIDPEGNRCFSLGVNHIDPATLRYPENVHIWRNVYGNSMKRWLQESVAPDLREWGFNCVGWSQEVVTRGLTNHRHSRPFTYEEYQWLDMPYCHLLPFADFHQWEAETIHPDFFSDDFANWCDHVAREHCVPLSEDPKLIGYFYVDVLSFQQFGNPEMIKTDFERWRETIDMPILLADGSGARLRADGTRGQDGARYQRTLEVLRANPACVGFHLCGAYLCNRVRKRGLRDEKDQPDREAVELISAANRETTRWVKQFAGD